MSLVRSFSKKQTSPTKLQPIADVDDESRAPVTPTTNEALKAMPKAGPGARCTTSGRVRVAHVHLHALADRASHDCACLQMRRSTP